ncbi:uncharacterized protein LOC114757509 [Neltuma alba]|uniref:uncharacterized protein LOC114757509 n=1 Tax=Neltuma alba TaxID=207710 RepID=UPI0010A44370|nr:uncharacterized protein LOC114757509 [Prosopis alba]
MQPKRSIEDGITVWVDGTFSHISGKAACGGLIRNNEGNVMEAFMLNINSGDPLVVEIWTCLIGFKRAWEGGHRKVTLLSNSLEAIQLIKEGATEIHENWDLIQEVGNLLQRQ